MRTFLFVSLLSFSSLAPAQTEEPEQMEYRTQEETARQEQEDREGTLEEEGYPIPEVERLEQPYELGPLPSEREEEVAPRVEVPDVNVQCNCPQVPPRPVEERKEKEEEVSEIIPDPGYQYTEPWDEEREGEEDQEIEIAE